MNEYFNEHEWWTSKSHVSYIPYYILGVSTILNLLHDPFFEGVRIFISTLK